ncbi:fimbrial protein [Pseudoxanthomonas sp.]|uniref:fimbrial protein n=1 Tax=Pseudoxanthomonas sp. TaxID=1871049 RepID=UPI002E154FEF|nr:fimbrial protein [Pseudoxanthomonas sp.]
MKKNTALLLALCLATAPLAAQAGVLNVTGEIVQSTCTVGSASANLNIDLGRVDASQLATAGDEAALTAMPITLDCVADNQQVAVMFGSQANADATSGHLNLLPGVDAASNVQVAIYNQAGEKQRVNHAPTAGSFVSTVNGSLTLNYLAAFHATGQATPGLANTNAVFTVVYQ